VVRRLEFFFDYASPWSYMASCQIEAVCAEAGATLEWRPVPMAQLFDKVNHGVAEMRAHPVPAKVKHYWKDMRDWARRLGIRIERPPVYGGASKQLDSMRALRGGLIAHQAGRLQPYTRAVYEAYWHDLEDVSQADVLAKAARKAGLDMAEWERRIDDEALTAELTRSADELIARGGFGVPTFFVDGADMYFGNDRLDFVREALLRSSKGD
jgi:2-hydroxychromene-2-carboxylate isomerase